MINFIKNVYIHPPDEYIQSAFRILPRFPSKKSILPNDFMRYISKTILDFILISQVLNTGKKSVTAILYGNQSLQDICPGRCTPAYTVYRIPCQKAARFRNQAALPRDKKSVSSQLHLQDSNRYGYSVPSPRTKLYFWNKTAQPALFASSVSNCAFVPA